MLQKIGFAPGINKQVTETGAEGQWVDCDNVRFRYGTPEKELIEFYTRIQEVYFMTYILLKLQQLYLMHLVQPTDQLL